MSKPGRWGAVKVGDIAEYRTPFGNVGGYVVEYVSREREPDFPAGVVELRHPEDPTDFILENRTNVRKTGEAR